MSTTLSFERGNYRRVCDSCGALWNRSELSKKKDGLWYCRGCDNLIPSIVLDERAAKAPTLTVRPVPDAKPHDAIATGIDIEGRMFNVLDEVAPYRYYDVTGGTWGGPVGAVDITTAAETIRAFYNIVVENKRQTVVIARAKKRILDLADWLLTVQYGSATAPAAYTAASTATEYGAFTTAADPTSATVYSADVAAGGLALTNAYALLGNGRHLVGAKAAALCLRRLQEGDKRTINFSSTASLGSTPLHLGAWTHSFLRCSTSPAALVSRAPTPNGSVCATFLGGTPWDGTITIVFGSAVVVSAWSLTLAGSPVSGSVSPSLGSSATTWTLTSSVTGAGAVGAWATTVLADQSSPCKAQAVGWAWTGLACAL